MSGPTVSAGSSSTCATPRGPPTSTDASGHKASHKTQELVATIGRVEVGIRELRADLSRVIKRVREGEEIVVTDRGRAVARIVPLDRHRKIDRLIAAGIVSAPPRPWHGPPPRPIKAKGTVSDLVAEQRR